MHGLTVGNSLNVNGRYIPHGQVVDFGAIQAEEEVRVPDPMRLQDVISQAANGEGSERFWARLIQINFARVGSPGVKSANTKASLGRPFLHGAVIIEAKKRSGLADIDAVVAYIDLNYGELEPFNVIDMPSRLQVSTGIGNYCGLCEAGWLYREDSDPQYAGTQMARPCECNARGIRDIKEYRQRLRNTGREQ